MLIQREVGSAQARREGGVTQRRKGARMVLFYCAANVLVGILINLEKSVDSPCTYRRHRQYQNQYHTPVSPRSACRALGSLKNHRASIQTSRLTSYRAEGSDLSSREGFQRRDVAHRATAQEGGETKVILGAMKRRTPRPRRPS
ncbi:hypothetical protein EI94DRAFT_1042829 [Lactarius quietus]|nr:hypothetical protein EI94DRAFT_1042829 [Lactarius quietus]